MAGAVRGAGGAAEVVAVHGDGSTLLLHPDGTRSPLRGSIEGFDPRAAPVLSGNGRVMAFRTLDGQWYARKETGRRVRLPDAASSALPVLSPDVSTIVYRTAKNAAMVASLSDRAISFVGVLQGCTRGVRITAAAFASGAARVVLGDAAGNLCVWVLAGGSGPQGPFTVRAALPGPIVALAVDRDGNRAAVVDTRGTLGVWTVAGRTIREVASLTFEAGPRAC